MIEDHVAVEGDQRMASTFLRLILISVPVAAIVIYFAMFGRRADTPAVAKAPVPASEIVHPANQAEATHGCATVQEAARREVRHGSQFSAGQTASARRSGRRPLRGPWP